MFGSWLINETDQENNCSHNVVTHQTTLWHETYSGCCFCFLLLLFLFVCCCFLCVFVVVVLGWVFWGVWFYLLFWGFLFGFFRFFYIIITTGMVARGHHCHGFEYAISAENKSHRPRIFFIKVISEVRPCPVITFHPKTFLSGSCGVWFPPVITLVLKTWPSIWNKTQNVGHDKEGRKEMFYLTTHLTHFIYGYMASFIW